MKISETDDPAEKFHEVQITIDTSELYAEIVEVFEASGNKPGFVLVTSLRVIEPHTGCEHEVSTNFRRFET
jgi:hypothetical protein